MATGFRLVMTQGPQPGQTFTLDRDVLTAGRDPGNDISINHPQISRQHARLTRRGGMMVLEDLGSTNGTFVNGVRLSGPHTLTNGDVVGLGDAVTLTFYGQPTSADETVIARPGAVPPPPPPPPPAPAQPASYAAQQPPAYAPAPAPAPAPVPPELAAPAKKKRTGMWIGCGCGTVIGLIVLAIVALFVLDYFHMLPPVFYEPLRWLGLF